MNARTALLDQWRKVLVFSFGADDSDFAPLPDLRSFPQSLPLAPEATEGRCDADALSNAAWMVGGVITIAVLKSHRPPPECEVEYTSEWTFVLSDTCERLRAVRLTRSYGQDLWTSCLGGLGSVLELAMLAPDRLPALHARLDALNAADLHRLAMEAVQGLGSEDLLADLLRPAEVAP